MRVVLLLIFSNVISSAKKCRACEVVASEIDTAHRILKPAASKEDMTTLKAFLEDKFCSSLSYSHQPYSWLEPTCDEMVDEQLDSIIDVMKFHQKVVGTGLTPSQSMPQMLCEELYACGKNNLAAKKTNKKSASNMHVEDKDL